MVSLRPGIVLARGLRFALVIACALSAPARARADGAFADSKMILLPRSQPQRIIASSDLAGLLVSDDAGMTWSWICEAEIGHFAGLFQLGPQPDETMFAITQLGLARSSDAGCSWERIGGVAQRAGDAFPDPSDPQRVFMVAQLAPSDWDDPVRPDVVVVSADGGKTFGEALYMTTAASITGVEVSRSDPRRVYLTLSGFDPAHPYIARSNDGGASWNKTDLFVQLGQRPLVLRIVAIDPQDPDTIYVRMSNGSKDALAITRDGGSTIHIAHELEDRMSAFLLRSDGAIVAASADGTSVISRDGGESFEPWSEALHMQALAERDGMLYAVANNRLDGFALASSRDGGRSWRPMLTFDQLRGPPACGDVAATCDASWSSLAPSLSALANTGRMTSALRAPAADGGVTRGAGGCRASGAGSESLWWLLSGIALAHRSSRIRKREDMT
jgi:photosystem II stability/assembly factor-like uncharacterized protein